MKRIVFGWFFAGLVTAIAIVRPALTQDQSGRAGDRGGSPGGDRGSAPASYRRFKPADGAEQVSEELEKTYARMSEQLQQPVPKRTFETATEPLKKRKLFRADPKLLENKFMVHVVLLTKQGEEKNDENNRFGPTSRSQIRQTDWQLAGRWGPGNGKGGYPDDLVRLVSWGTSYLFSPAANFQNAEQLSLSQQHKLFLEHCAAPEQPQPKAIDFLTSDDCNRDVIRIPFDPAPNTPKQEGWSYTIYAPSAEEGEQRAAALMHLVDCGVCRPMQQYFLAEGNKRMENSRKQYALVAKQGTVLRAEEEKLAKPSEISADILSQLKAQKVMVAIELAGLSARVKACDEMLKDLKRLEISTLQSISDMKVKAEVERIGIKEKLDQINAFIGEGDNRRMLRERIIELRGTYDSAAGLAHAYEIEATTMSRLFDLYSPLPLKDNQIMISPVEWTN